MRRLLSCLGLGLILNLSVGAAAQPLSALVKPAITGAWVNPENTIQVETSICGELLCGWVVAADAAAIRDARDAGTVTLIGTRLLLDYRQAGPALWRGRLFLPDEGKSYVSSIQQLSTNAIKVSGCILGGWICRSQVWHRA